MGEIPILGAKGGFEMKYAEMRRNRPSRHITIHPPGADPLLVDGEIKCRYSPLCQKAIEGNCTLSDEVANSNCQIFLEWAKKLTKVTA